jgi:membrane associated rhomboid family serine protease
MFPIRDTQPSYTTPVATILLIVTNALVFLFEMSLDDFSRNHFIAIYGLTPANAHLSAIVTSMFLHGGWMHVIGNMWFLWIFGDNVEDILGHTRFLVFYVICGIVAALTHIMFNPLSDIPTVGASGAIAGVMGAYLVKFPHSRIVTVVFFLFILRLEVPAVVMLAYWFLIQLFSGVGSIGYSHVSQGGVAWFAHVGGFVAGMILVNIMAIRRPYARRSDLSW